MVTFDLLLPDAGFSTLVPEKPDSFLIEGSIHGGRNLVLIYLRHAIHEIYVYDSTTGRSLGRIFDDLMGSIKVVGRRDENVMFVEYNSFVSPGTVYRQVFG